MIVADICLYGNRETGAGWLAQLADGRLLGDGEPRKNWSANDATWIACMKIQEAGLKSGRVRVFMAGGQRMAETDLCRPGYFGQLEWRPAPVLIFTAEEIEAAAATQAAEVFTPLRSDRNDLEWPDHNDADDHVDERFPMHEPWTGGDAP
jgi:hypothetical protein